MPEPRIYVAGHRGMVGSAIVRQLRNPPTRGLAAGNPGAAPEIVTRSHAELDLTNQSAVDAFFAKERPDQVYLAAAKVGGIHANNSYPAEFIYQNLMIEANIIHAAYTHGVQKLLFLGSSCIYPRLAPQPLAEDALLTGTLEPTNEAYAIAKIAGIKLCESYNRQYGTDLPQRHADQPLRPRRQLRPAEQPRHSGDDPQAAPGQTRRRTRLAGDRKRRSQARRHPRRPQDASSTTPAPASSSLSLTLWGTGTPRREFLYVDDMAAASVHVMNLDPATYAAHTQPMLSHINVGTGEDITIRELATTVASVIGYRGRIDFDASKPDGTPRKLMDVSRLHALGCRATVGLAEGLARAYADFRAA